MKKPLAALLASVGLACSEPNTQVIVIVDAQPGVRAQTGGLEIRIYGDERGEDMEAVPDMRVHESIVPTTSPFAWPRRYVVTPSDRDSSRLYRFEAVARRGPSLGDEQLVLARVISGYQRGRTVQIYLLLADSCIGVPCEDPDTTCDPILRMCVDARRDENDLPPFVPDGGVPDSGIPIERCTTSAECDDGMPCTDTVCTAEGTCATTYFDDRCTGSVPCAAGLCTPRGCESVAVDDRCNDGHACTVDTCELATGCVFTPDDDLCTMSPGGTCTATGCQYATCTAANCQSDDCNTASCNGTTCERTPVCGPGNFCCHGDCMVNCDDSNECTVDMCGSTGCVNTPRSGNCSDGNACTDFEYCSGTTCGNGDMCDDFNDCTTTQCNPSTGCTFPPIGGPCDNGSGCGGDYCSGGECFEGASCGSDGGMPPDAGQPEDAGYDAGRPDDAGGCTSDGECTDSEPCTRDQCLGRNCYNTPRPDCEDCGGGVTCNPMVGEECCGSGCCDLGFSCNGGTCVPDGAGCGAGPTCGGSSPYCCPADGGGSICQSSPCGTGCGGGPPCIAPGPYCCPADGGGFICQSSPCAMTGGPDAGP